MRAAQINDGAHAARGQRAQMAWRRLRRPPDPIRDLMKVGVGLADQPVVDQPQIEVVDGRAETRRATHGGSPAPAATCHSRIPVRKRRRCALANFTI